MGPIPSLAYWSGGLSWAWGSTLSEAPCVMLKPDLSSGFICFIPISDRPYSLDFVFPQLTFHLRFGYIY